MDEELLQEGYKTTKENIILIDMFRRGLIKIWSGLKVGDDDSIQDFDLGPFKNYILLASDQIECHQKVLSAAISSSQRLQHRPIEWKTMGNLTKFITVDTKDRIISNIHVKFRRIRRAPQYTDTVRFHASIFKFCCSQTPDLETLIRTPSLFNCVDPIIHDPEAPVPYVVREGRVGAVDGVP